MRDAIRQLRSRLAAYAVDIAVLAAVLVPLAFALQTVTGFRPTTGVGVWLASVLMISVPSWTYFTVSDASASGATLGKRLLGIAVVASDGAPRVGAGRAVVRTAVKLAPWELTHLTMFALSPALGTFSALQIALLWIVYALLAIYLAVALRNRGERSVHDLVAGTAVRPRRA